jgi:D-3-phosphoglycerate dehydrogenase
MGRFLAQLAPAHAGKITFIYNGKLARYDCAPLTVCGLAALLNRRTDQDVNMVNARLVAETMGIVVEEVRNTESESFSNLITLVMESPEGKRTISGTMFEGIAKIVKLRDFLTDFTPEEHMLVMHYQDRPGMLGKIGTILGESGINIGNMNLGRRKEEGEAMVVFSIDSPLEEATVKRIATEVGARFIKQIEM